jgi:adenine nucleotide transporter 17
LYRGLFPVLATLCCSNFVYFYTFNGLKTVYLGEMEKAGPIKDLTFAFIAGKITRLPVLEKTLCTMII